MWKLRSLLRGYQRRQRKFYESNQWLANAIGAMFSSGSNKFPGWGEPWPWNRKAEEARQKREMEEAREELDRIREEQQHNQTDDTEV